MSDQVAFALICPNCFKPVTFDHEVATGYRTSCAECQKPFFAVVMTVRAKTGRQNSKARNREITIRGAHLTGQEDLVTVVKSGTDDVEARSKDVVSITYRLGKDGNPAQAGVFQNYTVGKWWKLSVPGAGCGGAAACILFALAVAVGTANAQDPEVHVAYLPYVRRDPTPPPTQTPPPYWWDVKCADGRVDHLIHNGGFESPELFPWGWPRDLSSTAPQRSTVNPKAGEAALLFPGRVDRIGIGRAVQAVPLIGYARPGERGPQLRAARLRYWYITEHDTPPDGTRDYLGVEVWGCAYNDDGDVTVYNRVDVLSFANPINDQRGQWVRVEDEVTSQMRYYGGGRRCVGLIGISEDDGTPADIFFDEVTLEVCTDP